MSTQITYKFQEERVTQLAAYILKLNNGQPENYTKLLKLLYLIDRESLNQWGHTITHDRVVNMSHGPVLSKTYDRIKRGSPDSYWRRHIGGNSTFGIELISDPGEGELTEADKLIANKIFEKFRNNSYSQMIEYCHELPEWEDPQKSGSKAQPLSIEKILEALGKSEQNISLIQEETLANEHMKNLLNC